MRTALIDADIAAYKAASVAQESFDFMGNGGRAVVVDEQVCRDECDRYVAKVRAATESDEVIICLSDPQNNWRKELCPEYKENRSKNERPHLLLLAKEYLYVHYRSMIRPRLEADDIMGILSTSGDKWIKGEKVIVSEDKDMRTVPGLLYAPHRADLGIIEISPLDADRFHMYQTVTGDPVDGYFGAKGAGPKAAEDILGADADELWDMVLWEYQTRGMTEDDALINARQAHILRCSDYNNTAKKVRLWQPYWLL